MINFVVQKYKQNVLGNRNFMILSWSSKSKITMIGL